MKRIVLLLCCFAGVLQAQQKPSPAAAPWWAETTALASDRMQGRDTGSDAYERAAQYVAKRFTQYGLKPAGENGTYFQRVAMHQVDLDTAKSTVMLTTMLDAAGHAASDEPAVPLRLLEEMTVSPRDGMAVDLSGYLVFTGYGTVRETDAARLRGAIAVFFNNTPATMTTAERETFTAERVRKLTAAGVGAIVSIDNPTAIEPFHWPAAYARSVTLAAAGSQPAAYDAHSPVVLRISAEAAAKMFRRADGMPGSMSWPGLLKLAEAGKPLPTFNLGSFMKLHLVTTSKDIASTNILATLPGTDKALTGEYVALSAHLDGYGYGTPVLGDSLYNGALDDAAYVATLLELARLTAAAPPRRSLLFCIFTGEEKGLLGSQYFTRHLTVPAAAIVADLNLDQLRPIFPLRILTMEGLAESSLGDTARGIAAGFGIELRPDREIERNLYRRADNYSFVRIGVPIASFIFGYNPGSDEERIYRDWYARRYHKPQDDLTTPIDWEAAVKFNQFYRALALAVANAPQRPVWNHQP